jgi:predicted metal-dependent HD superfamily phosphohydrolase
MGQSIETLNRVKKFATDILKNELSEEFIYHDLNHTLRVVEAVERIGRESNLSDDELDLVTISAWFHDTGYKNGCVKHEESGALIARNFLESLDYPSETISRVEGCIMASQMPQNPTNLLEEILCDADLSHLAGEDYAELADKMHKELEHIKGEEMSDELWNEMNYQFFKDHEYFTNYGKEVLEPVKKKNLKSIKKEFKQKQKKSAAYLKELETKVEKLQNKLDKRPERGIETMFRTTSKNHLDLSGMADNKANIMISVNTIILSLVVSILIRRLVEFPNLLYPTLLLVVVCLTTIVLSILATRPNVSSGVFTDEDVLSKKTNLLFFGNFYKMDVKHYEWGVREMMKDGDYLYSSLTRDIYFLGKVLGKKYKYLRIAYTTFMIGFVLAILAFLFAMLFFTPDGEAGFYTF